MNVHVTVHAGIVPYINASIILQLLSTAFPGLKKMQREGGPQVPPGFQTLPSRCNVGPV